MAPDVPSPSQVDAVQASHERCRQHEAFLPNFYQTFLASDPAISPMFQGTDFDRQRRLLQHALGLLLSFARRANPHLLERIAVRHGPGDLNIPADLYPRFVDALLEAVARHDPEYTPELAAAWRATLAPGIAYMEHYGR